MWGPRSLDLDEIQVVGQGAAGSGAAVAGAQKAHGR